VRLDLCTVPVALAVISLDGWALIRGWDGGRRGLWAVFDLGLLGILVLLVIGCFVVA
jgi:hypothetical protein